jgi:hypothetical protein
MAWSISSALMKDYVNSRSLLVPVAESLADSCSDGELSALLNSTPTPDQFYWPDKTTEHSRLSRFGMTCAPLTADRGAELLTWYRAGFPARTSAHLEAGKGLTANEADCGAKWQGSLTKYDHDSHSWKTAQFSLLGGLDEFSETWPKSGSMRNMECFLREPLEPTTCANESGYWPTMNTTGWRSDGELKLLAGVVSLAEYEALSDRACRSKKDRFAPRLPTPTVAMRKGSSGGALTRKSGKSRTNDRLDYALEGDGKSGRLNPEWVDWFMGWPIGWTALNALETDKFQEWRQQHSHCLLGEPESLNRAAA